MLCVVELLDRDLFIFVNKNGSLVIVDVAVVWGAENGYYGREFFLAVPRVELVSFHFYLVGPDYAE